MSTSSAFTGITGFLFRHASISSMLALDSAVKSKPKTAGSSRLSFYDYLAIGFLRISDQKGFS